MTARRGSRDDDLVDAAVLIGGIALGLLALKMLLEADDDDEEDY